jgi:hypothetical protein
VATWADLTAAKQCTLLARLGEALAAGAAGVAVAADQGHFHLRPCSAQTLPPTDRTADPLPPLIAEGILAVDRVDLESAGHRQIAGAIDHPRLPQTLCTCLGPDREASRTSSTWDRNASFACEAAPVWRWLSPRSRHRGSIQVAGSDPATLTIFYFANSEFYPQ